MIKVLFVCLGNICRSPAAQGVMEDLVKKRALEEKIYVESAGTGAWHTGELPDSRMREAARTRGLDLKSRAKALHSSHYQEFDYIIPMDEDNDSVCQQRAPFQTKAKIIPMKEFIRSTKIHGVPDPYYGGEKGFYLVLDLLEEGCSNLLDFILKGMEK